MNDPLLQFFCAGSRTLPPPQRAVMAEQRKPRLRLLCLHGFRTSGSILKTQLGKWSSSIHDLLELTCLDAPFPASGKSDVEGKFPPPYFEWYLPNADYTILKGFDEAIKYISDSLKRYGPFDGLLGFSQGAVIAGLLTCLQQKGLALQDIDPFKILVIVGGAKSRSPKMQLAYEGITKCASIHFLGEKDFLLPHGQELIKSFHEPLVINHPYGHTIPRLDGEASSRVIAYMQNVIHQSATSLEEIDEDLGE